MINFFIYSTLGVILGSIIGMYHNESGFIIKVALILLVINLIFIIINKKYYKSIDFQEFLKYFSLLLISAVISNIYIYSFQKSTLNQEVVISKTNLKLLEKTETDGKIMFKLVDEFHKKYYFAQNTKFFNPQQSEIKNFQLGETRCAETYIYTSYKLYTYTDSINSSFDIALYYKGQGYDYYVKSLKILEDSQCLKDKTIIGSAPKDNFYSLLEQLIILKNIISHKALIYFRDNIQKAGATNYETSIMMAMSWGDEKLLTKETQEMFKYSGLSHILVLSGFNLAIVLSIIFITFKKISVRKKIVLSFIFLSVFMILANTSVPVWRAFMMSLYGLLTYYFYKQDNIKYALWLSLFLFCVSSPLSTILDVSLHLSFLATLGIIYFYQPLEMLIKNNFTKYNNDKKTKTTTTITNHQTLNKITNGILEYADFGNVKNVILSASLVSLSASILIIPYLIFQFNTYNFWSIIFNILITFLIPIITIISIILSLVFIPVISSILYLISSICIKIVSYFANVSASLYNKNYIIEINFYQMIIIYIIIYIIYQIIIFFNKIKS